MSEERLKTLDEVLSGIAESGKIAQAYILEGADSEALLACAKAFSARIGASAADTIFVDREKPHILSVSDIRNGLVSDVAIRPYDSRYKVYIVSHAEDMNPQAQNALLKTLEEPPEYVMILLLTGNAKIFLPTILSRCVKLSDAAHTEEAFSSEEEEEARKLVDSLFENASALQTERILQASADFAAKKNVSPVILERFLVWIDEILYCRMTGHVKEKSALRTPAAARYLADKMSYEGLNRCAEAVSETEKRLDANVNTEMSFEMLVLALSEALNA